MFTKLWKSYYFPSKKVSLIMKLKTTMKNLMFTLRNVYVISPVQEISQIDNQSTLIQKHRYV